MTVSGTFPSVREEIPLVSVIIPCYNQGRFLGEAIESIRCQSHRHWEIVVVDDGSTDNTAEVTSRYAEARLVRQSNRGVSAARNEGLARSTGPFAVFLDADDRLLPSALETGVSCLRAHPDCAFVYGHFVSISEDGSLRSATHPQPTLDGGHYAALLRTNFIGMTGIVMYRREALAQGKGFDLDPSVQGCEDYELYLRIAKEHRIWGHGQIVAEYRRYDDSLSRNYGRMLRASLCALEGQRRFVRRDRDLREAHTEGLRFWRDYYGKKTLNQASAAWSRGDRTGAVRNALVLARFAPGVLGDWIKHKTTRLAWSRRAGVVPTKSNGLG